MSPARKALAPSRHRLERWRYYALQRGDVETWACETSRLIGQRLGMHVRVRTSRRRRMTHGDATVWQRWRLAAHPILGWDVCSDVE